MKSKFRHKPTEVYAEQFFPSPEIGEPEQYECGVNTDSGVPYGKRGRWWIYAHRNRKGADTINAQECNVIPGDWIVENEYHAIVVYSALEFEKVYELVEE